MDRAGHIGEVFGSICSLHLLIRCTSGVIVPVSCGLRLIPDACICAVNVHCVGRKCMFQGGDGHEGDCVVYHL